MIITWVKLTEEELILDTSSKTNVKLKDLYEMRYDKKDYLFQVIGVETDGDIYICTLKETSPWTIRLSRKEDLNIKDLMGKKLKKVKKEECDKERNSQTL